MHGNVVCFQNPVAFSEYSNSTSILSNSAVINCFIREYSYFAATSKISASLILLSLMVHTCNNWLLRGKRYSGPCVMNRGEKRDCNTLKTAKITDY